MKSCKSSWSTGMLRPCASPIALATLKLPSVKAPERGFPFAPADATISEFPAPDTMTTLPQTMPEVGSTVYIQSEEPHLKLGGEPTGHTLVTETELLVTATYGESSPLADIMGAPVIYGEKLNVFHYFRDCPERGRFLPLSTSARKEGGFVLDERCRFVPKPAQFDGVPRPNYFPRQSER